ncbi:hypothetical protein [Paenibacillus gorillae]|uniref:hypothetical protein n=1 Tax=Paenibacillus gorillae TaxID=1243662 RepID=UPI0004B7A77F|nr:hypothetical protein [Paenibacillus gorillae]
MELQMKTASAKLAAGKKGLDATVILVIIIVTVNVVAALFFLLPSWLELRNGRAEAALEQQNVLTAQAQFTTDIISDEDIGQLANKAPFYPKDSGILLTAVKLAEASKAALVDFSQDSAFSDSQSDNLLVDPAASAGAAEGERPAAATGSQVTSQPIRITAAGHMENVLQYLRNVQREERLIAVEQWSIKLLKEADLDDDLKNSIYINPSLPVYVLDMKLVFYSLPAYAKELGGEVHAVSEAKPDELDALKSKYGKLSWDTAANK